MTPALHLEILDLRHFSASNLKPVLDEESRVWDERLRWDFNASANLLLQYLDSHLLPGFVAIENGRICGYVFCVYEETKAVIGDVFALAQPPADSASAQAAARDAHGAFDPRVLERSLEGSHVMRIQKVGHF